MTISSYLSKSLSVITMKNPRNAHLRLLIKIFSIHMFCIPHLFFFTGLDHEANVRKMRLLTFIQMAENQTEMSFELIMQELQLGSEEVEGFIIDGKSSLVV